jgi:hypothetical protein
LDLANVIIGHKQGARMMAYKCIHCAYFHIKEAEPINGKAVRVKA